jgi:hypothetical protein
MNHLLRPISHSFADTQSDYEYEKLEKARNDMDDRVDDRMPPAGWIKYSLKKHIYFNLFKNVFFACVQFSNAGWTSLPAATATTPTTWLNRNGRRVQVFRTVNLVDPTFDR